jgi:hypothetical protein
MSKSARWLINDLLAHFIAGADAERRIKRGHFVILVLRPAFETDDRGTARKPCGRPGKHLSGLLHGGLGIARHPEEIGGRVLVGAAARGENLAHHFVVGFIGGGTIRESIRQTRTRLSRPRYFRLACSRSPHFSVQWSINAGLAISLSIRRLAFHFGWRYASETKGADFVGIRQLTGQIQRYAAQEPGVVNQPGRLNLQALKFRVNQLVDVVILSQLLPGEARRGIKNSNRERM